MTQPTAAGRAAGTGCVVLFLTPFAATGVVTGTLALRHAVAGEWGSAAFMGLFALTFGLVGIGGIYAVVRGARAAAETDATRARHPDAPWLWRADWASGRIQDGNRGAMVAAWILAGFWNLISLPSAFFGVRQALEESKPAAWLVLLFPAVGVLLLVWAVRATLRYRRYGISRLDLATVPVPIGRELRGTVLAPGVLEVRDGLSVTLTCLRRVTRGSGKNRSTSETVLWQEEQRVPATRSRTAEGMVTSIPVAFGIPADAEPADTTDSRNQVIWRLAVSAEVPGVDYHSTFEVPVFRTAAQENADAAETPSLPAAPRPFVQPATSRIKVDRNRRGTEIVFPAARNPGASAGLTAFLAIWLVAVWATVYLDAPTFFQVIFAGFGALIAWATMASWFGVSRVTVGDGSVTVGRGLFAPWREQRMAAVDVAEVTTRIGMQAGGTPYYDLLLIRKDGRKVPAGRAIRDKREAEWLADTVREALRT